MAQFVTHIQPTLVEAAHHHVPHPHHFHHHEKHDKHDKHEKHDKHHKDGGGELQTSKEHKEKHGTKIHLPKLGHAGHSPQHYPVLPHTPTHHHHHEQHGSEQEKRDSGQYLDSHGIPHTYQLHFIDSQGIHRDYHGYVEEHMEKDFQQEKEYYQERQWDKRELHMEMEEVVARKAVPEDRSPFEKSPSRDDKRPTPPQFINLKGVENKYQVSKRAHYALKVRHILY